MFNANFKKNLISTDIFIQNTIFLKRIIADTFGSSASNIKLLDKLASNYVKIMQCLDRKDLLSLIKKALIFLDELSEASKNIANSEFIKIVSGIKGIYEQLTLDFSNSEILPAHFFGSSSFLKQTEHHRIIDNVSAEDGEIKVRLIGNEPIQHDLKNFEASNDITITKNSDLESSSTEFSKDIVSRRIISEKEISIPSHIPIYYTQSIDGIQSSSLSITQILKVHRYQKQPLSLLSTNFPFKNENFVEREEFKNILKKNSQRKELDSPLRLVYYGMRGVGKTQLAIAISYELCLRQKFSHIRFIAANSLENIKRALIQLVIENNLFYDDSIGSEEILKDEKKCLEYINKAKQWCSTHSDVLIIFDNAKYEILKDYLFDSDLTRGASVMITSCSSQWPASYEKHYLNLFSLEEAQTCFKTIFGHQYIEKDEQDEQLVELIKSLGFLPLAIAQAAQHFKNGFKNIEKYLQQLQQTPQNVLAYKSLPVGNSHLPVFTSWDFDFETMPEEARILLKLCAVKKEGVSLDSLKDKWNQLVEQPDFQKLFSEKKAEASPDFFKNKSASFKKFYDAKKYLEQHCFFMPLKDDIAFMSTEKNPLNNIVIHPLLSIVIMIKMNDSERNIYQKIWGDMNSFSPCLIIKK